MKIYFAGSIRGGRDDKETYIQIIQFLKNRAEVLTEHLGDKTLTSSGEEKVPDKIYTRDIEWLKEADVVIAEVSMPSLGVGYEIAKAEEFGKKILCLYRPNSERRLSAMIAGNKAVVIGEYGSMEDVKPIIDSFLQTL